MAQTKGMSETIQIVIVIVVILVAALTILAIFSGGISQAGGVILTWISDIAGKPIPFVSANCQDIGGTCDTPPCTTDKKSGPGFCEAPKVCCVTR